MGQIFFLKLHLEVMGQNLNEGPRVRVSIWGDSAGPPGPEYAVLPRVPPRDHPEKGV